MCHRGQTVGGGGWQHLMFEIRFPCTPFLARMSVHVMDVRTLHRRRKGGGGGGIPQLCIGRDYHCVMFLTLYWTVSRNVTIGWWHSESKHLPTPNALVFSSTGLQPQKGSWRGGGVCGGFFCFFFIELMFISYQNLWRRSHQDHHCPRTHQFWSIHNRSGSCPHWRERGKGF